MAGPVGEPFGAGNTGKWVPVDVEIANWKVGHWDDGLVFSLFRKLSDDRLIGFPEWYVAAFDELQSGGIVRRCGIGGGPHHPHASRGFSAADREQDKPTHSSLYRI